MGPEQWTQIPLLAKLLKLIVNEMQNAFEEVEDCDDEDSDDGWEGDSQDSQDSDTSFGAGGDGKIDLSKLLAPAEGLLEDVEEEDPDCKSDPLYSLDLKQYLVTFLREFCVQPYFSQHFAGHLSAGEQQTLRTLKNVTTSTMNMTTLVVCRTI